MVKVKLEASRSSVSETPEGLEIVIPSKKNIFLLAFLCFWLCGWTVGGYAALQQVLSPRNPDKVAWFLIAWLGGWTLGEIFAFYVLLWGITGREILRISPLTLFYKRDILGLGRLREFELIHIKALRIYATSTGLWGSGSGLEFWGVGGGIIAFDYGAKTYRMGAAMEEAEAKQIINKIIEKFPNLK